LPPFSSLWSQLTQEDGILGPPVYTWGKRTIFCSNKVNTPKRMYILTRSWQKPSKDLLLLLQVPEILPFESQILELRLSPMSEWKHSWLS
jgi:hypothetical protein